MKIRLTIIALLFFTNSFAQEKYFKATVHTGEYGLLETNFIVKENANYLYGTTKPDANKRIIGGLKGSFAKSMFQKDGSVMELDSIAINENIVTGYLLIEKRKYYLQGKKDGELITAAITGKKTGKVYGKIELTVVNSLVVPKNYVAVWDEIKVLTENLIYNKKVLATKEWTDFVKYMNDFSPKAQEDGEFMYAFFYKSKELPFSHYFLTGNKDNATTFEIAGSSTEMPKNLIKPSLKAINDQTYLLDVPAFNFRVNAIDSIMNVVVNSAAKNLIIDLRQNPGGDMEGAMRICQYITDKTIYGGVVLAQSYWNKNQSAPTLADYNKFKVMNSANYEWFKKEVKNGVEGLSIVATPLEKTYKGKIYILTSDQTASAAEPFVYALQKEKVAEVIGAKTAGAVVSMEIFNIQNFAMSIPILDYYTFDGKRLDKIGVNPDVACDPKDALNVVLEKIKNNN